MAKTVKMLAECRVNGTQLALLEIEGTFVVRLVGGNGVQIGRWYHKIEIEGYKAYIAAQHTYGFVTL